MPYKYIGKAVLYKGKPLWELLSNLENFGVGRYIVRHTMQRYQEPTFMKILKVQALPIEVNIVLIVKKCIFVFFVKKME